MARHAGWRMARKAPHRSLSIRTLQPNRGPHALVCRTITVAPVNKTLQHRLSKLTVRCKASRKFIPLLDRQLSGHLACLPDGMGTVAIVQQGRELRRRELVATHHLVRNKISLDALLAFRRRGSRPGARRSSGLQVELDQPAPIGEARHLDRHDCTLLSRAIEDQALHCRTLVQDDRAYPPEHQHEWLCLGLEAIRFRSR